MKGHRGYNISPRLKTGKNEICGKSCREEYCKDHRNKIRNGSKIPRPCLKCGIGIRSQIQLCRGCGRETERQRLKRLNLLLRDQNPIERIVIIMYYNNGPWKKRNNRAKPAEAETNRLGLSKRKYNIYLCEKQRNKKNTST